MILARTSGSSKLYDGDRCQIRAIREFAIFVLAEARMIFRKVGKLRDRAPDRNSPEFVATIFSSVLGRTGRIDRGEG